MKNTIFKFTFLSFCIFVGVVSFAQGPGCPQINAQVGTGASTTICQGNCVTLTSTVVPINQNNTYSIQSIPYAPYSFTTGTSIIANTDDVWSAVTPLGFNFCYFGNSFSNCIIGSNGQLSFDLTKAGGYDGWSITTAIPSLADMPGNTICTAFRDTDPTSVGNIYFAYYGAAPCRALVVSWNNVPLYSSACASSFPNSTYQLVLYENTNYIDVYIQNSPSCTSWNGGHGIVGIQNATGTLAYSPPGRNYPNTWTAVNEAWRFVPTGAPNYTVTWSDPTGPIGTGLSLNVCPAATTNYTATLQMVGCSSGPLSFNSVTQVSVVPGPTLSVNSATICQGEYATLNVSGAANYTWSPGGSNASSVTFTPVVTTIYTVVGTSSGTTNCISSATTNINVNVAVPANPTNNSPICEGTALNLSVAAAASYTWTGPNGFVSNAQNPVIPNSTVNESGVYSVTLTSVAGCTTTASTTVVVIPLPVPVASNNGPLCSGKDLVITGSGSTVYSWTGPNGFVSTQANNTIQNSTPAASGVYNLIAGVGACTVAASTTVLVHPSPVASIANSGAVCAGLPIYLTGSGGATYSWVGPGGFASSAQNPTLYPSSIVNSGVFSLTVSDTVGCSNTATMSVLIYPVPIADFNNAPIRPVINGENDVYFTDATHGATVAEWNWYFMNTAEFTSTSQNPHFLYENPGDYVVALVVKSDKGCMDTILRPLKVYEDYGIYVPNVFTPNGDGVNDIFQPKGFGIVKYNMMIYDRWGEKVFETSDFEKGWDGTKQSKHDVKYGVMADGSYTWQIKLTNTFGEAKEFTGHVILMK